MAVPSEGVAGGLRELDSLTVLDLVDNEIDFLSTPCGCFGTSRGRLGYEGSCTWLLKRRRVDFQRVLDAGHGLSLLCVAESGGERRGVLFDAGPTPELFRSNAEKLGDSLDLAVADELVLSHWHIDHSGGFRSAVPLIAAARARAGKPPVVVDLHPDWPCARALQLPSGLAEMLPGNPSPQEFSSMGADVRVTAEEHLICGGCFYVSGRIPRVTDFERGFPNHMTQMQPDEELRPDPDLMDERYLACRVKGSGIVVFSACSHAGIVNVVRDATDRLGGPLLGVVGGFHLAGALGEEARIKPTVDALKAHKPMLVLGGHCTGWRAKAALQNELGDVFQPLSVGGRYTFMPPPPPPPQPEATVAECP